MIHIVPFYNSPCDRYFWLLDAPRNGCAEKTIGILTAEEVGQLLGGN